tara:strand:- start:2162 stop:2770 length:609 start_codon:yes stop_codon:yes gene_type:complete
MPEGDFKRQTAYRIKVGDVFKGRPIFDGERFSFLELGDRKIARINVVANVVERYLSDEKNYMSLTIDDASGQVRIKVFGEDIARFEEIGQGDTVNVIGLLRSYNNEIYINPEIIKKKDPRYLLVRKLEFEKAAPKPVDNEKVIAVADVILKKIKEAEPEGVGVDKIIEDLKESADLINQEVKKALEQGIIYEPRPGMLRYLG